MINSVQQGMAAELDFQAIIDLVGDKLREVFDAQRHRHLVCSTHERQPRSCTYAFEHGVRQHLAMPPRPINKLRRQR